MPTQTFAASDARIESSTLLGGSGFTFVPDGSTVGFYFRGTGCSLKVYPQDAGDETLAVSVDGGAVAQVPGGPQSSFNVVPLASGLADAVHAVAVTTVGRFALDGPALAGVTGSVPDLVVSRTPVSGADPAVLYLGPSDPFSSDLVWRYGEVLLDVVGTGFDLRAYGAGSAPSVFVSVDGGAEVALALAPSQVQAYRLFSGAPSARHTVAVRVNPDGDRVGFPATGEGGAYGALGYALGPGASVAPSSLPRAARGAAPDGPARVGALDAGASCRFVGTGCEALVSTTGGKWLAWLDGSAGAAGTTRAVANNNVTAAEWVAVASGLPAGPHELQVFAVDHGRAGVYALRPTGAGAALVPAPARKRVLFVGDSLTDSITAGVNRPDSTTGFCFRLAAEMRLNAVNLGSPGYTTAAERGVVATYVAAVAAGQADAPDMVNVLLGHNDLSGNLSAGAWASDYSGLLADLTAAFPLAKILCHEVVRAGGAADAYNAALPGIVAAAGANASLFRDTLYADQSVELLGDGIHLTDAGYPAFVRRWAPEFRRLLGLDFRRRRATAGVG